MDTTEPADRWFAAPDIRIHGLDWGGPDRAPVVLMLHGVKAVASAIENFVVRNAERV